MSVIQRVRSAGRGKWPTIASLADLGDIPESLQKLHVHGEEYNWIVELDVYFVSSA